MKTLLKIFSFYFLLAVMLCLQFFIITVQADETTGGNTEKPPIVEEEQQPSDNPSDDTTGDDSSNLDAIKEMLKQNKSTVEDTIVALVVSLMGSMAFSIVIRLTLNKTIRSLREKIAVLEQINKVSNDAVNVYCAAIDELKTQMNEYNIKNEQRAEQVQQLLQLYEKNKEQSAILVNKLLTNKKKEVKNDENSKQENS